MGITSRSASTEAIAHRGLSAAEIAAAVRAGGGVGFAAHPFSRGGQMLVPSIARRIVLPHAWPALEEDGGLDGVELWSVLTDAAEAWRTPAEAVRWLRQPEAAIAAGPPARHLAIWDRSQPFAASRRSAASTIISVASASAAGFVRRCPTGGRSTSCAPTWSATRLSPATSRRIARRSSARSEPVRHGSTARSWRPPMAVGCGQNAATARPSRWELKASPAVLSASAPPASCRGQRDPRR